MIWHFHFLTGPIADWDVKLTQTTSCIPPTLSFLSSQIKSLKSTFFLWHFMPYIYPGGKVTLEKVWKGANLLVDATKGREADCHYLRCHTWSPLSLSLDVTAFSCSGRSSGRGRGCHWCALGRLRAATGAPAQAPVDDQQQPPSAGPTIHCARPPQYQNQNCTIEILIFLGRNMKKCLKSNEIFIVFFLSILMKTVISHASR